MNKLLLLFLSISLLIYSCKSDKEEFNQVDEQGRKQGVWQYFYETGELEKTVHYKDDYQYGPEVRLYPSGQKNLEMFWDGDSLGTYLTGEYKHYYPDGQLLQIMNYEKGVPKGPFKFYHENGKVELEGQYSDGLKTGVWKKYRDDGSLEKEVNYTNYEQEWSEDFKAGVHNYYSTSGKLYYIATYISGQLIEDLVIDPELYEKYILNTADTAAE